MIKYATDITTDNMSVWMISPIDTVIPIVLLFTTYPKTYIISTFITTLDKPKVTIENGIVSIFMIFLMIALKNQNTNHNIANVIYTLVPHVTLNPSSGIKVLTTYSIILFAAMVLTKCAISDIIDVLHI